MVSVTALAKVCGDCREELGLDQFSRRAPGSELRHSYCKRCRSAQARASRLVKRDAGFRHFARRVWRAPDYRAVTAVCDRMARQLGGPDELAEMFKRQLDAAPRGSQAAMIWFRTFFRLLEAAEHHRADAFSRMTTQELEDVLVRIVERALKDADAADMPTADEPGDRARLMPMLNAEP